MALVEARADVNAADNKVCGAIKEKNTAIKAHGASFLGGYVGFHNLLLFIHLLIMVVIDYCCCRRLV